MQTSGVALSPPLSKGGWTPFSDTAHGEVCIRSRGSSGIWLGCIFRSLPFLAPTVEVVIERAIEGARSQLDEQIDAVRRPHCICCFLINHLAIG